MLNTNDIGTQGELLAFTFLKSKGLKLREKNYRCKLGEIDLIMKDQDTIVFIEVRKRKNSLHGSSIESIRPDKQHRIIQTATHYLLSQNLYDKVYTRFDVIGIDDRENITWVRSAFELSYTR